MTPLAPEGTALRLLQDTNYPSKTERLTAQLKTTHLSDSKSQIKGNPPAKSSEEKKTSKTARKIIRRRPKQQKQAKKSHPRRSGK